MHDLAQFRGIFPAAMTMFGENDLLDENATARHWDWLISQGVDGLVIAGTSGEFIALENHERIRLFQMAQEVVAGRVPLVYGAGHYSTRLTIDLCREAEKYGADAVIIILPYYQRPPKTSVIKHFRDLREVVKLPVMLYNNPANTACVDLTPSEVAGLAEEGVLQMVKSTYESVVPVHDLKYLVGNRMAVFYGSFMAALEGLLAGADGWISGILNVVPAAAGEMYQACNVQQDLSRARQIWNRILPLVHLYTHSKLGPASDLTIYRSILNLWGLQGGYSRRPFYPLTPEQERILEKELHRTGWSDPRAALQAL